MSGEEEPQNVTKPPKSTPHSDLDGVHRDEKPNVESAVELDRIIAVAQSKGARPEIAIRVNPAVGAGGHARITTGGAGDKFGVPARDAPALYARTNFYDRAIVDVIVRPKGHVRTKIW